MCHSVSTNEKCLGHLVTTLDDSPSFFDLKTWLTHLFLYPHSMYASMHDTHLPPPTHTHTHTFPPLPRYHTSYAYLATIVLCFAYKRNWLQAMALRLRRRRQDYRDIPDAMGDQQHQQLPLFQQNAYHASTNTNRVVAAMWNRLVIVIRNMTQRCCRRGRHSARNTKRRRE
jgi:hypothetical protein